eukprot:gene471-6882_t
MKKKCNDYHQEGFCFKGEKCPYYHSENNLEIPQKKFFFDFEMKIAKENLQLDSKVEKIIENYSKPNISKIISDLNFLNKTIEEEEKIKKNSEKKPTLEDDRREIAEYYKTQKEMEGKKRKLQHQQEVENSKPQKKKSTNKTATIIDMTLLNEIDESFDHTQVTIDSKKNSKKVKLDPNPEHLKQHKQKPKIIEKKVEKKLELVDPYLLENEINFKSYENVKIDKPRIPLSLNFHIPRDLRQKSLEMLVEKYKTIFEKRKALIYSIETEIKINNEHKMKSAYWSKVKHVIKNIKLKD